MLLMLPTPGKTEGSPRWPTKTVYVQPLRQRQHVHAHLVTRARTDARILVTARQQKFLKIIQLKSRSLAFQTSFWVSSTAIYVSLNEQDFIGILIFLFLFQN